ncbi:MAG: hypothetical protein KatS3mg111_1474 [Pirellulaceae bacterium]|nr:MAG: hypothetical protein KatS3mg111_1474 [Pirellulaceae bacterium]
MTDSERDASQDAAAERPLTEDSSGDDRGEFWRTWEWCSWGAAAMLIVLAVVNGPSVSTDQFVIRTLVVIAVVTAVIVSLTHRFLGWPR